MRILIFILLAVSLQAQSPLYRVEWNPDEVAGAENLLLDDYPGAAAAYSLRQLRDGVINVIRVRKDDTNAEADFSVEQITDGTLAAFVGAGNNGYVVTWYDQSGNNYHATQTTAARQPKIYDASTGLVMENGKPAIDFDGTDDFLRSFSPNQTVTDYFTFIVFNKRITNKENFILLYNNNTTRETQISLLPTSTVIRTWYDFDSQSSVFTTLSDFSNNSHLLFHHFMNQNALTIGLDGITYANQDPISSFNRNFSAVKISGAGDSASRTLGGILSGILQEIIIYTTDESPNREGIETDINSHYNIY